jgi:hypothetical protein
VWLSSPARTVLDALPRRGPGVFTPARTGTPLSVQAFDAFWCTVYA